MTTLLAALFVFGVLVTVHEFGHFITAKMTGMRVDEFAIGFGPNIFQKKYGETLYSLRIIPSRWAGIIKLPAWSRMSLPMRARSSPNRYRRVCWLYWQAF